MVSTVCLVLVCLGKEIRSSGFRECTLMALRTIFSPVARRALTRFVRNSSGDIPMPVSVETSIYRVLGTRNDVLTRNNDSSPIAVFILHSLDCDVEGVNAIPYALVLESRQAKLLNSIVGVGNQFSEEYFPGATISSSVDARVRG